MGEQLELTLAEPGHRCDVCHAPTGVRVGQRWVCDRHMVSWLRCWYKR